MTVEIILIIVSLVLLYLIYNHRKSLLQKGHSFYKEMQAEERKILRGQEEMSEPIEETPAENPSHPAHVRHLLRKVEYHITKDEVDEAERAVRELLTISENDPHIQHQLGIVYIKRGDLQAAEELYKKLTELKLDAKHFVNLGQVYEMQNKLEDALDAYLYGLEMNKEYAANYMQAGFVYERLGLKQEAKDMYLKALELEPENGELREHVRTLKTF